jgi:hypothetical protein
MRALVQAIRTEVALQRQRLPRWLRYEWILVIGIGLLATGAIVIAEMNTADFTNRDRITYDVPLSATLQFDVALLMTIHLLVAFRAIAAGVGTFAWNGRGEMQESTNLHVNSALRMTLIKWFAALRQVCGLGIVLLAVWLETGFFINVSFGGFQWPLLIEGVIKFNWSRRVLLGLVLIPIFTLLELLFSTALGMAVHAFARNNRKAIVWAMTLRLLPTAIFSLDSKGLIDYGTGDTLFLIRPRPYGSGESFTRIILFIEMSVIAVFLVLSLVAIGLTARWFRKYSKAISQAQLP